MTSRYLILFLLLFTLCVTGKGNAFSTPDLERITEHSATSGMFERAVDFFTKKIPRCFEERLRNSHRYLDTISEIFSREGIPFEIAYLPLIESRFSPLAVGPGGAVGLWQFVKGTALNYGLIVDRYVDERRDPIKSTVAAAAYLNHLYSLFGSWDKTLAAYNAGEGRMRRIPDIYTSRKVPPITKRYLPSFAAAYVVAQDPDRFGFSVDEADSDDQEDFAEIATHKSVSLRAVAARYNTTVEKLKRLNPALLTDRTPPYTYTIRVPDI